MKEEALKYLSLGWSVIPIGDIKISNGKKEIIYPIQWKEFENRLATKSEIEEWFEIKKYKNIGILTGKISKLFVLDTDSYKPNFNQELFKSFNIPPTPCQRTARGGKQYFFKDEGNIRNAVNIFSKDSGMDVRANGGMVIVPPTKTSDGEYSWIVSPFMEKLSEIPENLRKLFCDEIKHHKKLSELINLYEGEGRDNAMTSLCGKLVLVTPPDKWATEVWSVMKSVNETYKPPLSDKDLKKIFKSITERHLINNYYNQELDFKIIKASEITPKPIEWLWKDKIAKGKVSLIAGNPGLGKSQVCLNLASIVSKGACFPASNEKVKEGKVIIFSAEDDYSDTIIPRIISNGGKIENINFIESIIKKDKEGNKKEEQFIIGEDMPILKQAIESIGNVSLVIVDPVSAYLGKTDSHKNSEVRGVLSALSKMAAEKSVAVIAVTHLNKDKDGKEVMMRFMGSLAFVAAARAAYLICKDSNDERRRLFVPVKNNLADDTKGLAFTLEKWGIIHQGIEIQTSKIEWEEKEFEVSANDVLSSKPEEIEEKENAEVWLYNLLKNIYPDGLSAKEIISSAKKEGISSRVLYAIRSKLKIQSIKSGDRNSRIWKIGD